MNSTQLIGMCVLSGATLLLSPMVNAGPIEDGKEAYVKNGCWQCHGYVGQGGVAGPKLAPDPKPAEFYAVFVRHSKGTMPPYGQAILSAQDLTNIHTYLKSIPKGAQAKDIKLLELVR